MYNNIYKIADKTIEIISNYEYVHKLFAGYEADGMPEHTIVISQRDIDSERAASVRERRYEGLPPHDHTEEELESTAVYRKIADRIIDSDRFVFHGSAISVDGRCYLFTAKSGTGKSTHAGLWRELFGNQAVMINDDKPILRIDDKGVTVYGTPYNGKHHLGSNTSAPLQAVCILQRAEENRIVKISKQEAYAALFQQVYRPNDEEQMRKTLTLIGKLLERVSLYRLSCNMDISAAETAYNGMKE